MENFNFINWTDMSSLRGRRSPKLKDFNVAIYRNVNPERKGKGGSSYMSFSVFLSEVYAEETKIRVGRINDKVVFQFNKVDGLPVRTMGLNGGKGRGCSRTSSAALVDMILDSFKIKLEKSTYRFDLVDLGNNTFLIEKLIQD